MLLPFQENTTVLLVARLEVGTILCTHSIISFYVIPVEYTRNAPDSYHVVMSLSVLL
jgi:hypothetical protein